jgi:hypothetical protein
MEHDLGGMRFQFGSSTHVRYAAYFNSSQSNRGSRSKATRVLEVCLNF